MSHSDFLVGLLSILAGLFPSPRPVLTLDPVFHGSFLVILESLLAYLSFIKFGICGGFRIFDLGFPKGDLDLPAGETPPELIVVLMLMLLMGDETLSSSSFAF